MSAEQERMPQRQLGELMTELGLISGEQLATVLEVQQRSKRPLGQIIVELGFASGAAVAHALAMQSGGALKTEYGFALGISPEHGDPDDEETSAGLPKLRLAPTAAQPRARAETAPVDESPPEDEVPTEEPAALDEVPAAPVPEPDQPEAAEAEAVETAEDDLVETLVKAVETATVETEPETEAVDDRSPEPDPVELEELQGEIERLENAPAEAQAGHEQELARLHDEHQHTTSGLEGLETALAEAQSRHEHELSRLREDYEQELNRVQERHEHADTELAGLQNSLAEVQTAAAEQARRLAEEQDRHAAERAGLQDELSAALERLAAAGNATEERDQLRAEVERVGAALAEAQAAAAEHDHLRDQVESLAAALAETRATHEEQLTRLQEEQAHATAELERLQAALGAAQVAAAEQEGRLAEEQERHAVERDELAAQSDGLQQALAAALEQLAVAGPAAEERDRLRAEVARLETALAEVQESCSVELRRVADERDNLTTELEEAQELLRQAERVRESQIALTAERDRALAEVEQLQSVAAEAQTNAEEQSRLLAEAQDQHQADRETLLAQRTVLEEELGNAIEQLAATAADDDERQRQLELGAERLRDALDEAHAAAAAGLERLDAVRRFAAGLTSRNEELPFEEAAEPTDSEPEPEVETKAEPASKSEPIDYSLFVPGPNGYELVPQAGIPPQPGDTVELLLPDREEPTLFEVVRSGRTLPGGDVCVYLAQV